MNATQPSCEDKLAALTQAYNEADQRAGFLLNEVSMCVMRERSTFLALEPDATMTLASLPTLAASRMEELKALRPRK